MAGRNRNQVTKLETTIEQCRGEGKWPRVIELADELKSGYPQVESLANFLMGEGKLESYLEEHPPIEDNFLKAKLGLSDAKRYLNSVIGESGKKAGIALDAHLLLAKLFYACGQYDESLQSFVLAELNTLSEKHLSPRSIRILAESYAIKGMCLEKKNAKAPSKFKQAEQETEMITCFERAADLGILFLQGQDNNNQSEVRRMGAVLETGLQRAPIVLIKTGKLQNAIDRYRMMLNAVETKATQTLRLTLARQLAEVLLRGVSGTIYTPPPNLSSGKSGSGGGGSKRLWEPRKYSARQQFIPRNQHEETILLLLIAEALAVRDAVLSQSPEFREARMHSLGNATAVYDLLTLATVRWNQVGLLHDSLEKALKFAFGEAHVWKQYAACLTAMGRYKHAVCALKEHSKLEPQDSLSCLMAARLCYEHLDQIKEGLAFAEEALSRESKGLRRSRAQLYVGIGLQQVAISSNLVSEKDRYNKLASEALERAVQQDPNDHLAEYYLACQHAYNYNITEALLHITNALSLRAEHASSLHLFALLLTANRRPKEALAVVQDATEEFPDNLNLLHVKAHLELYLKDVETALETVQQMLSIWREVYEVQLANAGSGMEHDHEKHSDTRSVLQMQSSQMSDKDSNSIHAASLAASRIEHALSEAASSLSSFSPRPGPQRAWMIQFKIWLLLADVYLAIEQPNEAINCIQEAGLINPVSHQVMYMRGQIHIYQQQWVEAKQSFQNAVAANPYHTEALRALGEAHLTLGEPRLAEKTLKDAARIDPNCPKIWFLLGRVMESLGDYTASADCMATALQLEPSCPVLPFTSIALVFE